MPEATGSGITKVHLVDEFGNTVALGGGGGSVDVATDTIWAAKGDLVAGLGVASADRVAVGTNGQTLVADSTATAGVKWGGLTDAGVSAISESKITNLTTDLAAKAPLASPALTGTPTVPTASALDNSTKAASTAYADGAVSVEAAARSTADALLAPSAGKIGGPGLIVMRATDSAARNSGNTGTTLTNDDTLTFAVGANDIWLVKGTLILGAANTAMDFKWAWSIPAGATLVHGSVGLASSNLAGWGDTPSANTPIELADATTAIATATTTSQKLGMEVQGIYKGGGTAGTVTFQWAQNTADAGNLVLKAMSMLCCTRLA